MFSEIKLELFLTVFFYIFVYVLSEEQSV